ncbi:putative ribonuclease H-like domain-containing protein [Tanacetum coccineum]
MAKLILGASVNTAVRPVNTAGLKTTVNHPRPISNAYKKGYSQVTRPVNKYSANKNTIFNKKVNTVRVKDTTARDRAVGNPHQKEYKEKGVIDSGCSRHMTGNKCYLTEYEDYDGGFVSFRDGKGRISRKGTRDNIVTGQAKKKIKPEQEYILIPFCITDPLISQGPKDSEEDSRMKPTEVDVSGASDKDGEDDQATRSEFERLLQQEKQTVHPNSTNSINTVSTHVSTTGPSFTNDAPSSPVNVARTSEEHLFEQFSPFKNAFTPPDVPNVFSIDDTGIFAGTYDDEDMGGQADLNNLETTMNVSSIPTIIINKDYLIELIIGDLHSAPLTRRMSQQNLEKHCFVSYINKLRRTNHKDYQNCLFACFLSQKEPKKVIQALEDPSWIEAMQEELLQFELQKVWTLVDLPNGKRTIRTKWVFRNKRDERGIVVRNKARLVAQGYTQEEGIDYDEVFAPVAKIEAIRLFLAYASFMGFIVYQMDVKSAFLYGTIEEVVYVCQPPSFEDPHFLDKVDKVEKALYGLHEPSGFDVDSLSKSMNYVPVVAGNQTNGIEGTRDNIVAGQAKKKTEPEQEYILIHICTTDPLISQDPKDSEEDAGVKPTEVDESKASNKDRKDEQDSRSEFERLLQQEKHTEHPNSTNSIDTVSTHVSTAEPSSTYDAPSSPVNAAKTSEEHLIK